MSTAVGRSRIKRIRAAPLPEVLPSRGKPSRRRRIIMTVIAAGVALAIAVPVVLWTRYRITHVVSRNALVKGSITNVGAQLDGVVTSVEVESGQQVQAGQILARFEDHQLQATVQRAQSRFEKATRELEVERMAIEHERRRLGSLVTEASARVAAAKAQVDAAQSQADDAKTRHELRQTLAQEGVIATEEVRAAETVRRTADAMGATAEADEQAAEAARDLAQVESEGLAVREEHIRVLEADVSMFRAELDLAEADLKAALIRAPGDGWVVRRIAEPGGSVVVGQPILALWIGKGVWVEAWIDEDDLGKVAAGSSARVTLKPYPDRVFSGVVETIGVSTDYELPDTAVPQPRNSRMRAEPVVCVRIRLDEPEGLFPGLSAVVGIRKK
ncbi:MAG TPA: efflux RND transporter periplasmic adaptor subunit [Candidatus Krumholzibacteria bacterium]|jgi:multidrug resistance efflux pump|nr:efflux RND transporter periplasmic adaptor subunit [Candidatus Krumholzibacteria bacterium]